MIDKNVKGEKVSPCTMDLGISEITDSPIERFTSGRQENIPARAPTIR
jgi:hypothetical protein